MRLDFETQMQDRLHCFGLGCRVCSWELEAEQPWLWPLVRNASREVLDCKFHGHLHPSSVLSCGGGADFELNTHMCLLDGCGVSKRYE